MWTFIHSLAYHLVNTHAHTCIHRVVYSNKCPILKQKQPIFFSATERKKKPRNWIYRIFRFPHKINTLLYLIAFNVTCKAMSCKCCVAQSYVCMRMRVWKRTHMDIHARTNTHLQPHARTHARKRTQMFVILLLWTVYVPRLRLSNCCFFRFEK